MREKINNLSKGIIDGISPKITYEPESFNFKADPEERVKLEIRISSADGLHIKGLMYSSDRFLRVLTPSFGGQNQTLSVDVTCHFDNDKTAIDAQLDMITNGGEITIPVHITKRIDDSSSWLSELNTIDDFASVAENNPVEAQRMFEYRGFSNSPCMTSIRNKALYHAFSGRNDKNLALHEFLYACGYRRPSDSAELSEAQASAYDGNRKQISSDDPESDFIHERQLRYKKTFFQYLNKRFLYEISSIKDTYATDDMLRLLDDLDAYHINDKMIALLKSEVFLLSDKNKEAEKYFLSVRNDILNNRQEMLFEYCLLEYVEALIYNNSGKTASFIRLLYKFFDEYQMPELLPFIIKLDSSLPEDDTRLYDFLNKAYLMGSRSPYLYFTYCSFLNLHPDFLHDPTPLDVHALHYGARMHLLHSELRSQIAARVKSVRQFYRLYYSLLKNLYQDYRDPELIHSICAMLIKSDRRDPSAFEWYRMGIEDDTTVTGLFEYYVSSVPSDSENNISDKAINYFLKNDSLDLKAKTVLYSNVIRRSKDNHDIILGYSQRIIDLIHSQLKDSRVDNRMAYIYSQMLQPSMINAVNADSVQSILNTFRITTKSDKIVSCIILYPNLLDAHSYSFSNGTAYVPVYSDEAIILLQDRFGNRYASIPYKSEKLINRPDLDRIAAQINSGGMLSRLRTMDKLLKQNHISADEASFLEYAVSSMPLFPEYSSLIYRKLIDYYDFSSKKISRPEFLLNVNVKKLSLAEIKLLINAYIRCGCYHEALKLIREYGSDGVLYDNIKNMVSSLILENMFTEEDLILDLAHKTFEKGMYDNVILDYLCEHFNGPTDTMYRILSSGIANEIETYDMEERLFAQMIFANHYSNLDDVFEYYSRRKKISESIVKAYFTIKSVEFFFSGKDEDEKIFKYLEGVLARIDNPDTIPVIHMLALTKHYSQMDELSSECKQLCQVFIDSLISNGILFPFYKELAKFISIPTQIMNSQFLVYRSESDDFPVLRSKVLPIDNTYVPDPMKKMFMSFYLKRKVLFNDELWKYEISDRRGAIASVKQKGSISYQDIVTNHMHDRFDKLNSMPDCSEADNMDQAAKQLFDYIFEDRLTKKLFTIGQ